MFDQLFKSPRAIERPFYGPAPTRAAALPYPLCHAGQNREFAAPHCAAHAGVYRLAGFGNR